MASGGQWLGIGWAPWRGGTSPPSNASLPVPGPRRPICSASTLPQVYLFYACMSAVSGTMFRALAEMLGLPPQTFSRHATENSRATMRLLYYPAKGTGAGAAASLQEVVANADPDTLGIRRRDAGASASVCVMVLHSTEEPFFVVLVTRDALEGGAPPPPCRAMPVMHGVFIRH